MILHNPIQSWSIKPLIRFIIIVTHVQQFSNNPPLQFMLYYEILLFSL